MIGIHLQTHASIGARTLVPLSRLVNFSGITASVGCGKWSGAVQKGQGRSRPKGKSVFVQTVFSTEFAAGKTVP